VPAGGTQVLDSTEATGRSHGSVCSPPEKRTRRIVRPTPGTARNERRIMTAYALAHLRKAPIHADVLEYLERIQDTLIAFDGRFIVHGGTIDVLEGSWPGDLVIIEFPDMTTARSWYHSNAYQEIKPLRARHLAGELILVVGVEANHSSSQMAAELRQANGL
jgi:uncharacterized protein (DUF1330 family)